MIVQNAVCSGRRILLRYRRGYVKLWLGNVLTCRPPNNWSCRHDSKRSLSNRLWPKGLLCKPRFHRIWLPMTFGSFRKLKCALRGWKLEESEDFEKDTCEQSWRSLQDSSYMNTRHTSSRSANARCTKFIWDKDGYMSVDDYAPPSPSFIKMRTMRA
jgi:hypothetical protein